MGSMLSQVDSRRERQSEFSGEICGINLSVY